MSTMVSWKFPRQFHQGSGQSNTLPIIWIFRKCFRPPSSAVLFQLSATTTSAFQCPQSVRFHVPVFMRMCNMWRMRTGRRRKWKRSSRSIESIRHNSEKTLSLIPKNRIWVGSAVYFERGAHSNIKYFYRSRARSLTMLVTN